MSKSLNKKQIKLIEYLNSMQALSGAYLAEELAVSRTTIWKQIKQLQAYGLPIETLGNKGYQLKRPFICIEKEKIQENLQENSFSPPLCFHLFSTINSTNQFLKTLPLDNKTHCCISEQQTAGRGRFQRQWLSPFGQNLYFSMRYKMPCDLSKLSGLSLVVSLSVIRTLKKLNIPQELKIKWPNDILWENKKLSGNLIEVIAETHAESFLIIGIGLNVNMNQLPEGAGNMNYCSLTQLTHRYYDRNSIAALLINQLNQDLELFFQQGFKAFKENWLAFDYFANKKITVRQFEKNITGIAKGINDKGELLIEISDGNVVNLSSGDASIGSETL